MWSELLCQDDFLTKDSLDGLKTLKKISARCLQLVGKCMIEHIMDISQ